jgi:hypothetical protein
MRPRLTPYPTGGTYWQRLRWAAHIARHEPLQFEVGRDIAEACRAAVRAEVEARKAHRHEPLRWVELWRPQCPTCIDWTWPMDVEKGGVLNAEGKPAGMPRPGSNGLRVMGVTLEHLGGGRYRCPSCGYEGEHTSQRDVLQAFLVSTAAVFMMLGSNRSSKTFLGSVAGAMTAMGAGHPAVAEMLARNGLDPGRLNTGPAFVQTGSITYGDALTYLRPRYDLLLPRDWTRRSWDSQNDGAAFAPGSGIGRPGCVLSKTTSGAQPEARWQGASSPLIHNDDDHGNLKVFQEQEARVADQGGRILFTATPTKGKSPVMVDALFRDPPRSAGMVDRYRLDALDNPMIDGAAIRRWFAGMTEKQRMVRRFARFVRLEGLVHEGFDRAVHVVPALPLSEMRDWPRADGCDFGFRAPFAYVWMAIDPHGTVHVYRCRYQNRTDTDDHALEILRIESCPHCWPGDHLAADPGRWWDEKEAAARNCTHCEGTGRLWEEPYGRFADPADATARNRMGYLGISMQPADKARRRGFELCDRALQVEDGRPGVVFHDHPSVAPLIAEIEELAWKDDDASRRAQLREAVEMQVVGADHAWDAWRYGMMGAAAMHLVEYATEPDT